MSEKLDFGKSYPVGAGGKISMSFGDDALQEDLGQRIKSFVHFPAKAAGRVCLLANLPFPYRVHRWQGRWVFCYGPARCGHCHDRVGYKGRRAMPVYDMGRRCHGAFDFTPEAWQQVIEQAQAEGSLIGRVVCIRKENQVINGRFLIEVMHSIADPQSFGTPCDVPALVCSTYGLSIDEFDEEFLTTYYSRVCPPAPLVLARGAGSARLVE